MVNFMLRFFFIQLILFFLIFVFSPSVFAHSEVKVVEMTQNGFEAQQITVDQNSSVIFINKDTQDRWPASNVHPTHEIYPEFDPKRPIKIGESWVFKPTKVGEWKYHDHMLPHYRGVITVTSEAGTTSIQSPSLFENFKTSISNLFTKFKNFLGSFKKSPKINTLAHQDFKKLTPPQQEEELRKISQSQGAAKSWEYIKEVFKGEAGSSGNIHDLSHLSGILIYDSVGFEGIKQCSAQFSFGCFHGFLDQAFKKDLTHLMDAQNACLKLGRENSGPVASCIHGIGHGVASFHSTADLKASLQSCRKLTSGREYCFDGVFMEFVRSAPNNFYKADDSLYPCNALEKDFGPAYSFECGRNQPSMLMGRFKKGFEEVVSICQSAQSKPFKQGCFDSLGFSLAASQNVDQIVSGCLTIQDPQFISRCAKAAAGELVFQEAPNWDQKSKAVCNSISEGRDECLQHVNRLISDYNRTPSGDLDSFVREQLKSCYEINGRDGCYKKAAEVLYGKLGFAKTLKALKDNENYPEVYARCHEVTHYLSRSEFDKQQSIAKVYSQCDSTCHGGCYHGTMEAYLKNQLSSKNFDLNKDFAAICGKQSDYQSLVEFNECLHGMGHAAMFVTDMEFFQSLNLCDSMEAQEHKERCYTGVFMENSSSSTSFDHASKYTKQNDPFYPCNVMEEKYLPLCWQYQSSYFALINGQDWVKVANMCMQIPQQHQDRCFRAIGTNQVGYTTSLEVMRDDCEQMPNEHFQDVCVGGVVSSMAYRFVGDPKKMLTFCSLVNSEHKETCFKQMGTAFLEWTQKLDQQEGYCQQIADPQGQDFCLSALNHNG